MIFYISLTCISLTLVIFYNKYMSLWEPTNIFYIVRSCIYPWQYWVYMQLLNCVIIYNKYMSLYEKLRVFFRSYDLLYPLPYCVCMYHINSATFYLTIWQSTSILQSYITSFMFYIQYAYISLTNQLQSIQYQKQGHTESLDWV